MRGESESSTGAWETLRQRVEAGEAVPFAEQWLTFQRAAEECASEPTAWAPSVDRIAASNLGAWMAERGLESYEALHAWSAGERAEFWGAAVERLGIVFCTRPTATLDAQSSATNPAWFPAARLNATDSCFRHPSDATAIVHASEADPTLKRLSFGELEALTNGVAHSLRHAGFGAGDAIALYMPMNVECVAAYLGIVRAGCRAVSIADSFPAAEVAKRLAIAGAQGVITVDGFTRAGKTHRLFATLVEANAPRTVVIRDAGVDAPLRKDDLTWRDFLTDAPHFDSVATTPDAVTNILFSSGTTGEPKAIPWTQLTPIKCAMDGHFHQDIQAGDVVAWPTNIGWMMGPWLIYASLVNGAAIALFEGGPATTQFTRFVGDAGVTMLGVVPTLVRAWRKLGALESTDWQSIRTFSSTGEASNAEDYLWLMSKTRYQAPVIEYCGGTEVGGGYITGTVLQPAVPATFTTPALGIDFRVLDGEDSQVAEGESGEVFLVPPSVGLSQKLLNRDHHQVYYADCPSGPAGETLRRHGDRLQRLAGGRWRAQGRADDTMNLGGVKISSIELEEVITAHHAVEECAAIAVQPAGGGADRLVVFAVTLDNIDVPQLKLELKQQIAQKLSPLFKLHDLVTVPSLPRTASNKVMRRTLRAQYARQGG